MENGTKIIAVSDLHGNLPLIPECDFLLLGGDYSPYRQPENEKKFFLGPFTDWLKANPVKRATIGIAGNHDFMLENEEFARSLPWVYVQDELVVLDELKLWGTPWTRNYYNWAFMAEEDELADKFAYIPDELDILLSHGPAYGILDKNDAGIHCGSSALRWKIDDVKIKAFVFGHIHEGRGYEKYEGIDCYNVTYCNTRNSPTYNPILIKVN